jgi:hypothetical protein
MIDTQRRRLLQLSLLTAFSGLVTPAAPAQATAVHDFDAFLGKWQVRHRRLQRRLVGSNDWEEYDGTSHWQPLLGGLANCNESVVHRAGATYQSLGLRAFNAKTNVWTDWSLNGRDPTKITVDGVGQFANGVGTFFADDTFEGKPIRVRGTFKLLTPRTMQWDQAFSPDAGRTWETNYVMHHTRVDE